MSERDSKSSITQEDVYNSIASELEDAFSAATRGLEEKLSRMLPMMKPVTLACSCGAYLAVMRTEDGWALGHLDAMDTKAIVAPTLEECIVEFTKRGIDHSAPSRQERVTP